MGEWKMLDLSTSFMGVAMSSPVVVGASPISRKIDSVRRAEEAGAGGLVVYSLFQEQIEHEREELEEALMIGSDHFAESLTYFPHLDHAGPREHIMWVEKTRAAVSFPLFGSLNAVSMGDWITYAKDLENAGVNGLELNIYAVETRPGHSGEEIESRALDVVSAVKASVGIPVALKIGPWYTSVANFASKAVQAGIDGLVLFNRFYQPFVDVRTQSLSTVLDLSRPEDTRLPLRWVAILSSALEVDLAAATGVHSGLDVVRHLLAGARAAQTVSSLLKNGIAHITAINKEISDWMVATGYSKVEDFRGKVSKKKLADPWAFERAQYVKLVSGPG